MASLFAHEGLGFWVQGLGFRDSGWAQGMVGGEGGGGGDGLWFWLGFREYYGHRFLVH